MTLPPEQQLPWYLFLLVSLCDRKCIHFSAIKFHRKWLVYLSSENLPAYFYLVAQVHWLERMCAWLEVTDVKVGESVIDEAVHCSIRAVHVLIDQSWDEVRSERDDKCLGKKKTAFLLTVFVKWNEQFKPGHLSDFWRSESIRWHWLKF